MTDCWERNHSWDDEDKEESVKDAWDQESEEEVTKEERKPAQAAAGTKKNLKKICKRFEEKERIKEAEAKARREKLKAELAAAPTTAERLRRRKLQEAADLAIAKEVYGVAEQPVNPS